jgi:hypothetical protein
MFSPDLVQKYLKIKALAERGEQGERENAARILATMAKNHPGLDVHAERFAEEQNETPEPDPFPSGVWPGNGSPSSNPADGSKFGGNWENIFNFARSAVNNAYDFASNMANAYLGRRVAEEYVETSTKFTKSNNVIISMKMSVSVYEYLDTLNTVQKQAFRQTLHEYLDEELDDLLGDD